MAPAPPTQPAASRTARRERRQGERRIARRDPRIVGRGIEDRARHVERFEDSFVEELAERLPADALDDPSEEDESGVGIRPSGAGLEIERRRRVLANQIVRLDRPHHSPIHEIEGIEIGVARHVVHEVEQRDIVRARQLRVVLPDLVIDRQLAVLREEQRRGGRELFRDRSDAEPRLVVHGGVHIDGATPEASGQKRPAVLYEGNRGTDATAASQLPFDARCKLLDVVGARWLTRRERACNGRHRDACECHHCCRDPATFHLIPLQPHGKSRAGRIMARLQARQSCDF